MNINKLYYSFFLLILVSSCNSSDDEILVFPFIKGKSFLATKVEIDIPIDINGDAIFSNDLTEESPACFLNPITFQTDYKVINPTVNDLISFNINYSNSGVAQSQSAACPNPSSIFPNYRQSGNSLTIYYPNASTVKTGSVSDDGNTITFSYTFLEFISLSYNGAGVSNNIILNEDGSVTEYFGEINFTYTVQ